MANCELHIPDDIIFDNIIFDNILPRLPAKSVIRFKCVCKSWLRNTETSDFIQLHLRQSLNDSHPSILLLSKDSPIRLGSTIYEFETSQRVRPIKLPSLPSDAFIILGFCNGLVLVRGKTWRNRCFLWNPSIPKVFRRLNFHHINYHGKKTSWHSLNLAYDETSDEYKMILKSDDNSEFLVYRLKADTWKSLAIPPDRDKIVVEIAGARQNNCLHYLDRSTDVIRRFDLGGEIWDDELDIFPNLPKHDENNCELRHFVKLLDVYKGMLCMGFEVKKIVRGLKCNDIWVRHEFWVMKEYGVKKSWTRLFCMEPARVTIISRVFYSLERDRLLLVDYDFRSLAWYNFSEDEVEEIDIQEELRVQEVQSFVPTLVPVDSISRYGITMKI